MVETRRLEQHRDERGVAYEPIDAASLPAQRNAHVVITRPGHVRGNHLHRETTEILTVRGPALVRYREQGTDRDVAIERDVVMTFRFPPGVAHAVLNTGSEPGVIVAFQDRHHEPRNPDTEPIVLIEPDRG